MKSILPLVSAGIFVLSACGGSESLEDNGSMSSAVTDSDENTKTDQNEVRSATTGGIDSPNFVLVGGVAPIDRVELGCQLFAQGWNAERGIHDEQAGPLGDGETSDTRAKEFYEEAAAIGNVDAEFRLGVFHESARGGLSSDVLTAIEWYKKAKAHGQSEASARLSAIVERHANGLGVGASSVEEESSEERAALGQRLFAQGWNAERGIDPGLRGPLADGETSEMRAKLYYEEAAALGSSDAQFRLGVMYEMGLPNLKADIITAIDWYKKARAGLQPEAEGRLRAIIARNVRVQGNCAVCLEEIIAGDKTRVVTECDHSLHLECFVTLAASNPKDHQNCPTCRRPMNQETVARERAIAERAAQAAARAAQDAGGSRRPVGVPQPPAPNPMENLTAALNALLGNTNLSPEILQNLQRTQAERNDLFRQMFPDLAPFVP